MYRRTNEDNYQRYATNKILKISKEYLRTVAIECISVLPRKDSYF